MWNRNAFTDPRAQDPLALADGTIDLVSLGLQALRAHHQPYQLRQGAVLAQALQRDPDTRRRQQLAQAQHRDVSEGAARAILDIRLRHGQPLYT